ncbi:MAG: hypothetical protein WA637_15910, partial [Terriglobales bacterium]
PFVAVLWGIMIHLWMRERVDAVWRLLVLACALLGVTTTMYALRTQAAVDARTQANTAFLESVVGDDRSMLASPFVLSLDYVNKHYPQLWAFVPENCPTMTLLDTRYGIGTLIMPSRPGTPEQKLCGTSLRFTGERLWNGASYWVYRGQTSGEQVLPRSSN